MDEKIEEIAIIELFSFFRNWVNYNFVIGVLAIQLRLILHLFLLRRI